MSDDDEKGRTPEYRRGYADGLLAAQAGDELCDRTLEQAPEFIEGRKTAEAEIAAGDLGTPLWEVSTELDGEDES